MAMFTVSAALRLERGLHVGELRAEAAQHVLDNMVRPDAKNLITDFSGQVPVPEVPGQSRELAGIPVPDLDEMFVGSLDKQPSPVVQLQAISVGHRDRFREVEQDVFALVRGHADAPAMARVEIESERSGGLFSRPLTSGAMNGSEVHRSSQ
jgi:hypothetical protein